jgi:hypothetical protein
MRTAATLALLMKTQSITMGSDHNGS